MISGVWVNKKMVPVRQVKVDLDYNKFTTDLQRVLVLSLSCSVHALILPIPGSLAVGGFGVQQHGALSSRLRDGDD